MSETDHHKPSDNESTNFYANRKTAIQEVCESAEKLKADFMEQMEVKLNAVINDVVHTMQKADAVDRYRINTSSSLSSSNKDSERLSRKVSVTGKLPEKVFVSRPSPLTELLQVTHFRTIHHIFIATLILIVLHTVVLDLVEQRTVDLGLLRLMWAFGRPQMTLGILLTLEFCGLVVLYPAFHLWSTLRLQAKPDLTKMIDYLAAFCFLVFLTGMMCIPAVIMWKNPLPPASGATVTMEQCRLLMKIYAFVRSNVPRVVKHNSSSQSRASVRKQKRQQELSKVSGKSLHSSENEDGKRQEAEDVTKTSSSSCVQRRRNGESEIFNTKSEELKSTSRSNTVEETDETDRNSQLGTWISWNDDKASCPSYSKYLYFYVAPTLIYKDNYPRTSYVRWDYVCWNFAQVLGCIVYANFILSRYSASYFINFGHPNHPMTVLQFCNAVFSMMAPGILGLVLGFFLLLHSWHNAFAEMLCFGDRLFYKDWWNCSSFHTYYKTWNILVHDWLYTYIFKDAWEMGLAKYNKALPTILVFVISSLFHEYVLSFSFNFFFPVLLTLFGGFGLALTFVRYADSSVGNIFIWLSLMAGSGILASTYTMEFYARLNCPVRIDDSIADFFTPRFWTCNAITWN
ncbi:Sterol O-acyltransferase 2 [Orchesella cincta]|uniref:O-acyltransferase n=1 Tax=Orchesella cincta TaxID=48709 RepID=A0A1D2NLI1_ORCCI|nr:Sterol O-acyltransferase 2 [Orchesella cincta]